MLEQPEEDRSRRVVWEAGYDLERLGSKRIFQVQAKKVSHNHLDVPVMSEARSQSVGQRRVRLD